MANSPLKAHSRTEVMDRGMEDLHRRLLADEAKAVYVGVLADEDADFVIIAAANEFGTEDGHIPPRPFVRSTVDEQQDKYHRQGAALLGQVTDGRMSKLEALALMGEMIQADIQRKITTLREPPNAPATVRKKKSDNPLVDSGRLQQSIRYEVRGE